MLNEREKALLRDAEARELDALDEDGLLALHDRIRRARNKYSKLYRRRAGDTVQRDATRAGAHAQHARTAAKAEAFEDALARVSRHLARAARASAAELKAERLAAARKQAVPARSPSSRKRAAAKPRGGAKVKRKTPASKKARASSRATTARRQAKRDAR
jgi:hypothetical protein